MFKQLITYLIILGLAIGISPAQARLIHHWKLDEDTAGGDAVAMDSVGGVNGDIEGAQSVPGKAGNALSFDGSDDVVTIQNFIPPQQGTVAFWMDPGFGSSKQRIFGAGGDFEVIVYSTGIVRNELFAGGSGTLQSSPGSVEPGQWFHIAVTYDYDGAGPSTALEVYVNGELDVVGTAGEPSVPTDTTLLLGHRAGAAGGEHYGGLLDDLRIYDRVLSEAEIRALANPPRVSARDPIPPNGAIHEDTWVNLSWTAGDFAVSHDVYIGDNFDDVNDGAEGTFAGNQTETFIVAGFPGFSYPDGLIPGTTYYWRVDEVNEAEPNSPWKGEVWSFSIPPNTAYNPNPADGAEFIGPDNVTLSWTAGLGAKLHTVYLGNDYNEVRNAIVGVPAGTATYNAGTLEREKVYYWRVDESDGIATYKGDIWGFTTPGATGNPQPANGAVDVEHTQILSWTPADNTNSHQVYFGTDKDAVKNATLDSPEYKGIKARGSEIYDPGKLAWHTSYYWRVDAVYNADPDNPVKGLVWSFTTTDFLVVDDFESYTNDDAAGEAIWQTWVDGLDVADNGAQVGYLLPPYCEDTIVHGGLQSMPLLYDNTASVTNSEVALPLTVNRDWTAEGVGELSLWFRGGLDNAAEPLYVAVFNSAGSPAVVGLDDPSAATVRSWTQWVIPTKAFADQGINLTNVDKFAIGLGTKAGVGVSGGSGTMYIDDIRLYRP
ncbi:MAG: LamG domain-containing protein [Anaerolineales bacterium]|nr:MAG: LamG domain-containing protein [Anaerolineales bacterium]